MTLSPASRQWIRRRLRPVELQGTLFWASLIGFLGALVTAGFREAIQVVEFMLTGQTGGLVEISSSLSPFRKLLTPTLGGAVAGMIMQYMMHLARGRKTTDYMEAVTVGDGFISVRASLVKSSSSLFSIGSGGSIGREGAMVQLSAMLGSVVGRLMDFSSRWRRMLVACGAAAGLAAVYNAPLAGTLFVAEIVFGSIELENLAPIVVSAVVANATVHSWMGYAALYAMPEFQLRSPWELAVYVLLGVLAGNLAPLFLWCLEKSQQLFRKVPGPLSLRFALGGLVVGLLSLITPDVWGNGYSVVNSILLNPWTWKALLIVLACKILATSATLGSGAVGGVFTPTLFCGAALGALVGSLAQLVAPGMVGRPADYAVIGMGAFMSATTHAPLMSILMVFEMTQNYQVMLPLMLASITSHYLAKFYRHGHSIYYESLHGSRPAPPPLPQPQLARFAWTDLVSTPEPTVLPEATAESLKDRFKQTPFNSLQVVDSSGRWLGVAGRSRVLAAANSTPAGELLEPTSRALNADMPLEEALESASEIRSEMLPVLRGRDDPHYLGTVYKSDLLLALRKRLGELRS